MAEGPIIRIDIATATPSLGEAGFADPKVQYGNRRPVSDAGVGLLRLLPLPPRMPKFGWRLEAGGVRVAERMPGRVDVPLQPAASCEPAASESHMTPVLPEMRVPARRYGLAAPQARIPSLAAIVDVQHSPAPVAFPAVHFQARDSHGTPDGPACRRETWIPCETRMVDPPGARVENKDSSVHPRMHVQLPGPPPGQEGPGVASGRYLRSEGRIVTLARAEPLQVLGKGERLSACEYRTRSML